MPSNPELHVVLGASGQVGKLLVTELLNRSQSVRAVIKDNKIVFPSMVQIKTADLLDAEQTREAVKDASVVYLCVNLPFAAKDWLTYWPLMMNNIIEACSINKSKLIFLDNSYVYGRFNGQITETLPYNPISIKGEARAKASTQLMDAHNAGKLKAVIARAADFYGPGAVNSMVGKSFYDEVIDKHKATWLGSTEKQHSFTYIQDIVSSLATLGSNANADGQIWHLPTAPNPLTGTEFARLVFMQLNLKLNVNAYSKRAITLAGIFNQKLKEISEVLYLYDEDFIFDSSKYQSVFGDVFPTSYLKGIEKTTTWFVENQ